MLIKTQNRIIEKLQRDLLYNDTFKNKNKNYSSTINTNMNANVYINENSTCSTLIPSINNKNYNYNNSLLNGKKIKKSNSCLYFSNINELKENCKNTKLDKNELNSDINFTTKFSHRHRVQRNTNNINSTIDNNINNNNVITNTFSNNNRNIRPFISFNKNIKHK